MVGFAVFARRKSEAVQQTPGGDLPEAVRQLLPLRFEAVGEALVSAGDVVGACSVVGGDVARDGAGLGEALSGLRTTYRLVLGGDPDFDAVEALSTAWSDATLEYLHDLSCEDPLTGLTSLAHVRTRLAEVYREDELTDVGVPHSHALVVVALRSRGREAVREHHFTRALRLCQVAEAIRAVFAGGQTIGRLGQSKAVALVNRSPDLGTSVATLVDYLDDLGLGRDDVRVWIEGLPASADSATRLLDELAR